MIISSQGGFKGMDGIAIDVLLIGFLERDEEGNVIPEGTSSTSTLIRCSGHNIVVDTGSPFMKAGIKTSLKQIGIFPEDVDILILTHNHSDHKGNVAMFPKAKVLVHDASNDLAERTLRVGDDGRIVLKKGDTDSAAFLVTL